ncbi:MAG: hypothetical protein KJ668_16270 [Proteobacteria bacterium]|nr:hypothetical protein [Pseudomonadota bacterium]
MIIFCLSACTALPVKSPVEKAKDQKQMPDSSKDKTKEDLSKISIVEILIVEAEKFSLQKNYQDALFVYNQALSQASENQKPSLILRIESVLAKTSIKIIQ